MNYPDFLSDMSKTGVLLSPATKSAWEYHLAKLQEYYYYIEGEIFAEKVPVNVPNGEPVPLMYPLAMNLCKMLCVAQADSMFGEWEDQIVKFAVRDDDKADDTSKKTIGLIDDILLNSDANSMFWEMEFTRNAFRGAPMKISPTLNYPYIRWSMPPVESFLPIWDVENPNKLLEVYLIYQITRDQARLIYGYDGGNDLPYRMEHWTEKYYENFLNGKRVEKDCGENPWGMVPFIYIPRVRTTDWYGDALTQEVMPIQNELNARLADIGEAINYNAHPVRWGFNLPKSFNNKNFPLDPNSLWDLGKTIGNSPPPAVGILEAKEAVSQGVLDYVRFIYDWGRASSSTPPIAFGEDEGSQRSGATLEIRMWSLIKSVRRSRAYFVEGLSAAVNLSGLILKQKNHSDIPAMAVKKLMDKSIRPVLSEVLPRDHAAIVDEVVKLRSTTPAPSISLETSQKVLSRGAGEVDRIKAEMGDKMLNPPEPAPSNNTQEAMKGKQAPQTDTKGKA
jgi:hypothetical protein